jgi:hypothetical protein
MCVPLPTTSPLSRDGVILGIRIVYHGDTLKRFEACVFPAIGRRPIAGVAAPELLALSMPP